MLAMYGNVTMQREYCKNCQRYSLVIRGEYQCCGDKTEVVPEKLKRMCEPEFKHRTPSKTEKDKILKRQGNICFYCGSRFRSVVYIGGRRVLVSIAWDHLVPFSYSANNRPSNFVACCKFCNAIKRDMVFNTLEEAQSYIVHRLAEKGYSHALDIVGEGKI